MIRRERTEDVAVLGDPGFYRRFGFIPAVAAGVGSPDPSWGEHFQVRTFGAQLVGNFRYAAPFQDA